MPLRQPSAQPCAAKARSNGTAGSRSPSSDTACAINQQRQARIVGRLAVIVEAKGLHVGHRSLLLSRIGNRRIAPALDFRSVLPGKTDGPPSIPIGRQFGGPVDRIGSAPRPARPPEPGAGAGRQAPHLQARGGGALRAPGDGRRGVGGRPHIRQLSALDGGQPDFGRRGRTRRRAESPIPTRPGIRGATPMVPRRSPRDHFVCVQSVVADNRGNLWVLDPASPGIDKVIRRRAQAGAHRARDQQGGPGHPFRRGRGAAGQLPERRPLSSRWRHGLHHRFRRPRRHRRGRSRSRAARSRRLDGHPSTQAEKGVEVTVAGEKLKRPDGRPFQVARRRHRAVARRAHALLAGAHRPHALPHRHRRAAVGQPGRRRARRSRRSASPTLPTAC